MTMTNEELAEAVARLNELHVTGNITEMYLIIRQLWAEREAMEKESTEQCRIIGAGGERELALMTKIEEQRREIEKVAAERSKMQEQIALAEHDRDFAERNHARIAANNMRLREQIEQQRAVMAQAKEALIGWESRNGGMHTRSDDGRKALAALESMGV